MNANPDKQVSWQHYEELNGANVEMQTEIKALHDSLDALQHTLRGMEVQEERLKLENAALLKRLEASDQWDDYNAIKALKAENAALKQQCETCETASVIDSYVRENAALRAAQQHLVIVATMAKAYMESCRYGHGIEDPLWHAARKALAAIDAARKEQP